MSDEPYDDLARFAVPPEDVARLLEAKRVAKRGVRRKAKRRFVLGPIPLSTVARAYRAHRAGLPVLLAIKAAVAMEQARTGTIMPVVTVTNAVCAEVGVAPNARLDAVRALAVAGLLNVTWHQRRAPRVSIPAGAF